MKFYQEKIDDVVRALKSSRDGISAKEAAARLKRDGPNILKIKGTPLWRKIIQPFASVMMVILFVAGGLSLWKGDTIDAVIVFAVILVSGVIDWIQQYSTEKILRNLRKREDELVEVMRDQKIREISAENLVVGDVIILYEGQKIPADARVIESENLHVDESILTGESLSVKKNSGELRGEKQVFEQQNMIFSGSFVLAGAGSAIVTATGNNTEFGKIAKLASTTRVESPIQKKIDHLVNIVVAVIFAIAAFVFFAELYQGIEAIEALKFIMALAVSAVPEGLPVAIAVVLALAMRRMAAEKALVRNLTALENIGLVTTIATDKTGTLTRNELRVQETWSPRFNATAFALQLSFALNTAKGNTLDPMDKALEIYLNQKNIAPASATNAKLLQSLPFDFHAAASGNIWQFGQKKVLYLKGAPEKIAKFCRLDERALAKIEEKNRAFASQGFRMIALAKIVLDSENSEKNNQENLATKASDSNQKKHEKNQAIPETAQKSANSAAKKSEKILTHLSQLKQNDGEFLGLIAIADELRPDAAAAVRQAHNAGVKVCMITGDQADTALHIAREIGIANDAAEVYDSRKLMKLSEKKLAIVTEATKVYSRVIPEAKHKILNGLNKSEITAMTGDGVNDVPALSQAHVGIAMGAGAAVAKDASDIVILDNNFRSIVTAIKEGRIVIANVRKMLVYLLATNAGEVLVAVGALLFGLPLPLVAVQILWINLATDTFMVIPLGLEPGHKNIMKENPLSPRAPILSKFMLSRIVVTALVLAATVLTVFALFLGWHGMDEARSAAFLVLIVMQWANAICFRGEEPLHKLLLTKNRVFFWALLAAMIFQFSVMSIPALRTALHLRAIHLDTVWAALISVAIMMSVLEAHKFLGRILARRGRRIY